MTQPSVTASAGTPPPGTPPPVQQTPAFDPKAMQAQLDELKATLGEKDQAIQYLTQKVNEKPATPKVETPADDEDETDVLDLLTSKGSKGLEKLLEKKGFVKKEVVDATVDAKANAIAKEQALIKEYPDLENKSSDFFKATAQHYGSLIKQHVAPEVAMEMAAERTALAFLREGKMQTPAQKKEADKAQREADRKARASAQSGDRGVRTPAAAEEDEELTPEQKQIIHGMGITEEAYKARANKGVSMRGVR